MSKDIRLAYIVDEIYKSLSQMCQMNGADLSEVIRELSAKQQLVDIRAGLVLGAGGGVSGVMSNDHRDNIVMDACHAQES